MIDIEKNDIKDVLESKKPTLLQFSADWCGPCKMLSPIVKGLSEENNGIVFRKINVDNDSETAIKFNVRNIPTLIYLKNGEVVDRMVGAQPKDAIQAKLDELLK